MARAMKYSGIEWIGEIPDTWAVIKLKHIGSLNANGVDKKIRDGEAKYKSVHYMDVYKNSLKEIGNNDYLIVSATDEKAASCSLQKGDVLFTNSSETPDDMGHSTVIAEKMEDTLFGYHLMRFRPLINIELGFEKYLFGSHYMRKWFEYRSKGITRYGITYDDFAELRTILPHFEEQQAIANYLNYKCFHIDSIIEKQKTVIEKLKLYKQSIITEVVTKGLDPNVKMKPSGIEWIGYIPEKWIVCRIKDVAELNPRFSDSFYFNNNDEVSFCPMECIGQGNMTPTVSTIDRVKNGYTFFTDGDIVMAKVTPCFENGNIAIADGLTNGIGFGSTELYVFRSKRVNRLFLFYFLQNTIFRERCISSMYGVGGLKRVPLEFINTYHLALPPIKEQRIIAEFLKYRCSQIDATVSIKQNLIDKLTDYKKSLIYECVTGKREVV